MSRWAHPRISPPRFDEDDWDDVVPSLGSGSADNAEAELALSESEMQREKRLRRAALERKRPPGFAPWPDA